jgi:ABC-type Fe3+-hydroxamate transport system substrate-binding protein
MRKHLILALGLFLVLASAFAAGAQTSSSSSSSSSTTDTTSSGTDTSGTHTTKSHAKHHVATGDVTATDANAQTLTIKHGKNSWTFKVDATTKFKGLGVKTLTLADFQIGDNVRVSYTQSGDDKMAARIDVLHLKKSAS